MPQGTYNAIDRMGSIVKDPDYAVRLADSDSWLGGFYSGTGLRTMAEYLLHRVKGVTLSETTEYLEENGHPDIVFERDKDGEVIMETYSWDADEGKYTLVED